MCPVADIIKMFVIIYVEKAPLILVIDHHNDRDSKGRTVEGTNVDFTQNFVFFGGGGNNFVYPAVILDFTYKYP